MSRLKYFTAQQVHQRVDTSAEKQHTAWVIRAICVFHLVVVRWDKTDPY